MSIYGKWWIQNLIVICVWTIDCLQLNHLLFFNPWFILLLTAVVKKCGFIERNQYYLGKSPSLTNHCFPSSSVKFPWHLYFSFSLPPIRISKSCACWIRFYSKESLYSWCADQIKWPQGYSEQFFSLYSFNIIDHIVQQWKFYVSSALL